MRRNISKPPDFSLTFSGFSESVETLIPPTPILSVHASIIYCRTEYNKVAPATSFSEYFKIILKSSLYITQLWYVLKTTLLVLLKQALTCLQASLNLDIWHYKILPRTSNFQYPQISKF